MVSCYHLGMTNPLANLTQADHDLLVRIAREDAFKAASAAIEAAMAYAHLYRQRMEAGDQAAMNEEEYGKILDVYDALGDAKRKLGEVAG